MTSEIQQAIAYSFDRDFRENPLRTKKSTFATTSKAPKCLPLMSTTSPKLNNNFKALISLKTKSEVQQYNQANQQRKKVVEGGTTTTKKLKEGLFGT